MVKIHNIPPNFFTDFLSAEEEEALFGESREEDDFILISTTSIFSRRTLARISEFFEEIVPRYHGNVFLYISLFLEWTVEARMKELQDYLN